MDRIVEGVRRFAQTTASEERTLFQKLATGQAPRALFITCSDSRVAPNLLTNTKPGEIFVIRNAGNMVPAYGTVDGGESATVEYAVAVLGIKHIIVCGHSDCGAMKALMTPGSTDALPAIKAWLRHGEPVRQVVEALEPDANPPERRDRAIEVNVVQQLVNLRTHPSVAAALYREDLTLHGWTYDIGSGSVRAYDAGAHEFLDLGEAHPADHQDLLAVLGHHHPEANG